MKVSWFIVLTAPFELMYCYFNILLSTDWFESIHKLDDILPVLCMPIHLHSCSI